MTFHPSMRFRDCSWCGLRRADMKVLAQDEYVSPAESTGRRSWTLMACSACGGPVALETAEGTYDVRMVVPEDTSGAAIPNLRRTWPSTSSTLNECSVPVSPTRRRCNWGGTWRLPQPRSA